MNARMAPWDSNLYFDAPVEQTFNLNPATGVQVLVADPQRVAILFGVTTQEFCTVSTLSGNVGDRGIGINFNGQSYLEITHEKYGPLVTLPWFAASTGTCTLSVISIRLDRWPSPNVENYNATIISGKQRSPMRNNPFYDRGRSSRSRVTISVPSPTRVPPTPER
jgi:hypothetical protein